MDVQHGIAERADNSEILGRLASVTAAARASGMRVVFVKIGFRDGYPEISRDNPVFSRIEKSGGFIEGRTSEIHPAVAPQPGDIVITKRRVSAFASTDLDAVLRVNGIDSLFLSGMSTSGVVLSTMRAAADLDFDLTVLSDGCADNEYGFPPRPHGADLLATGKRRDDRAMHRRARRLRGDG
jgi:nicotinamidase-related amidase